MDCVLMQCCSGSRFSLSRDKNATEELIFSCILPIGSILTGLITVCTKLGWGWPELPLLGGISLVVDFFVPSVTC